MADTKRLAFSIIQFLHDQLSSGGLSSDAQESLEGKTSVLESALDSGHSYVIGSQLTCPNLPVYLVAIQCLETAFGISVEDQSLAVSQSLPEVFASVTKQVKAVLGCHLKHVVLKCLFIVLNALPLIFIYSRLVQHKIRPVHPVIHLQRSS